ncbi:hypothetical protein K9U39_11350 [Rhodoblastus acidophilus]|uniref:Uncharacterized protein n=1 Tax=Candidatus Rhodoblastus alkanivorans TaxID=2954117 RepID=A0ABS9Z957_9HYPH|nr:hypothetical protein [Candidatus Rhodoblastus alkanivorans]MCI4678868.1 hypothetical protein [Candidatus Rhodoblastus alkanivorans]MCI4684208.1 hypothetical protein [Candidatus Rhodoblastus alkanivorans]MDI4641529.1 hypothetical protein [Rhodoblastus acidophilus]
MNAICKNSHELAERLDAAMTAIDALRSRRTQFGPDAFDAELDRLFDRRDDVIDEIEAPPAATIGDLILKARALKAFYPDSAALEPGHEAAQDVRLASQIVEALAAMGRAGEDRRPAIA